MGVATLYELTIAPPYAAGDQGGSMSDHAQPVETVDPVQARALIEAGAYLLDVRELDEWDAGHAPEAHHIPLGELQERFSDVPVGGTIVCVCRVGGRSARAAAALGAVGYRAINLAGGMVEWNEVGFPVTSDSGPGQVI
jgi:rhodanese-related sulfurtransferase